MIVLVRFIEVDSIIPGRIPGYLKIEKHDDSKSHGIVLYVHKRWNGLVRRVNPRTEDTNIEWIHVRMDSTPVLNIFGVYFDRRPRVDEAKLFWDKREINLTE